MRHKLIFLLTISFGMIMFMNACGFSDSDDTGDSTEKKVLNLSLENDIPDLNQVLTTDGISFDILNNIMEGLYRIDEDNEPKLAMAEDVDISDDKLTYTFHLRDDIKWSNGDDITADDFKYSWLRAMHPDTSGSYYDILSDYIIGGEEFYEGEADESEVAIDVKDEQTLEVELKEPTPYFLSLTAFATYFPLNEDFIDEVGEDDFALNKDNILYNGPFVMTEYDQADGVKLEKNDEYWDKDSVNLDEVNLDVIKEDSTGLNLYEAGDLDRIYLSSQTVDSYQNDDEFNTETKFNSWYLLFNFEEEPFDNLNIRKAFQMGYDQEMLTDTILRNGSVPAYGLVAKDVAGINDQSFREIADNLIEPDFDAAKEYLEKGIDEVGELPHIELLTADDTIAKDTATFLQSEFKENLDVDVDITTKPYSGRLDAMREDDYQMGISKWGSDYNDAMDILDLWDADPEPQGLRGNFDNKTYTDNIEKALKEKDEEKRLDYLINAEKILLQDEAGVGPLYFEGAAFLQKDNVHKVIVHPYGASLELKEADVK